MAIIKNFNTNLALNLFNDFGSQFSDPTSTYSANIGAAADTTITVPSASGIGKANDKLPKFLARFRYEAGKTVYVANATNNNGVTTAAPSLTGAFVANASIINPECKEVRGGDILHFYSAATANVTIEFYAI